MVFLLILKNRLLNLLKLKNHNGPSHVMRIFSVLKYITSMCNTDIDIYQQYVHETHVAVLP